MSINIVREGERLVTKGLTFLNNSEISLKFSPELEIRDAKLLLTSITNYISTTKINIKNEETFPYGFWLIKFIKKNDHLEIFEYNKEATEFICGANYTIDCWNKQHGICSKYSAPFSPPRPDRKIVISEGVYCGGNVTGVRYPSPEHMSGWWLTSDEYNGDTKTLKIVHLYHLTAHRPDIMPFIALPFGYRFFIQGAESSAWHDQKIDR